MCAMWRNPRFSFFPKDRSVVQCESVYGKIVTSLATQLVLVLFSDDVVTEQMTNKSLDVESTKDLSRTLLPPSRCWGGHVLSTWRHCSAVTQPAVVDWHLDLNRKKLRSKILQLLFAFLPSFTNHFRYFIRRIKSTVYSVMSHVAPANFQALDQRVSWRFSIARYEIVVFGDKGTWKMRNDAYVFRTVIPKVLQKIMCLFL